MKQRAIFGQDRLDQLLAHEVSHLIMAAALNISIVQFQLYEGEISIDGHVSIEADSFAAKYVSDAEAPTSAAACPTEVRDTLSRLILYWMAGCIADSVYLGLPFDPKNDSEDDYLAWQKALPYAVGSTDVNLINRYQNALLELANVLIVSESFMLLHGSFRKQVLETGASLVSESEISSFVLENTGHLSILKSIDYGKYFSLARTGTSESELFVVQKQLHVM